MSEAGRTWPAVSRRAVAQWHGVFNLVSGLWPLVHRRSFEGLLGPKCDYWLVNTVGGLLVGNGFVQLCSTRSPQGRAAARLVGLGAASTLATIDVVYVSRRRVSRVYLLDAAFEVAWVVAWIVSDEDGSVVGPRPRVTPLLHARARLNQAPGEDDEQDRQA
jgi:hypothetical protein